MWFLKGDGYIAKNVVVAAGLDARGKQVVKAKLNRAEVLPFFANYSPKAIGIETCAGAHYRARKLNSSGHDARLIAAQHVKPFVSCSKNDTNNAHAIAGLRSRASAKYVQINTEAQQDMQMLHRARQGVMGERKALICRLRALVLGWYHVSIQVAGKKSCWKLRSVATLFTHAAYSWRT